MTRKNATKWLKDMLKNMDLPQEQYQIALEMAIKALQEPKTGHWIRVTDNAGHLVWECDKCGWQQRLWTNYCPDCGARMESDK